MAPKPKKAPVKSAPERSRPLKRKAEEKTDAVLGAIRLELAKKPRYSLRYSPLTVKKEWPIRVMHTKKIVPTGNPQYLPGSVIHYNIITPQDCFYR